MNATASHLFLRALVDEFARCGMEHACTSPGSRNTPIVLSLARDGRISCWSHVDERCAGFFALGAAKASGRPVAVTCTSGTAAANLLPAVVEAREAGVPLVVLTADRPPELREVGAGQTIDQLKLFGDAVKWFVELGVPEATPEGLRWGRTLACRAYWTALDGRPGPVHLNVPLREPLVLHEPLPDDEPGGGGRAGGGPWVAIDRTIRPALTPSRHEFPAVLFVAGALGPDQDPELGHRVAAFAERARVPLLADPLSNARRGGAAIAHYDLILRDPVRAAALEPVVVCRIGELPTSKPLRAWLAGLDRAHHVSFAADGAWSDPDGRLMQRTVGPLRELLDRIEGDEIIPDDGEYLGRWRAADTAVIASALPALAAGGLSEPLVARTLGAELPPEVTLLVAASMPVRDVETWFPVRDDGPRLLSNRGANGIDGTVSTAFGIAAVGGGPVVLLIGDVALAHDVGGLLAARRTGLRITIVLLNNDGGGIFHFLPIAQERDAFERHVATPTGLPFDELASAYGCAYERPADPEGFRSALHRSLGADAATVIEVRTDRVQNRELHRRIETAARSALSPTERAAAHRA